MSLDIVYVISLIALAICCGAWVLVEMYRRNWWDRYGRLLVAILIMLGALFFVGYFVESLRQVLGEMAAIGAAVFIGALFYIREHQNAKSEEED